MENNIDIYNEKVFEEIKQYDEYGNTYWSARELMKVLEYAKWDKFLKVINVSMIACKASKYKASDHFLQVGKMVEIGSNTFRKVLDYHLTRYACYLIVQNADPRKQVVALGQTYFAIKTRLQEIGEEEYNKWENFYKVIKKA